MISQTNLGNAMTIINNTGHSLAQSATLVGWAETRRLGLNAMKPNKQPHTFSRLVLNAMKPNKPFQKHQISSILLVMVMCWASQSSAQPKRASHNLVAADFSNSVLAAKRLTPSIIKSVNKTLDDGCVFSEHQNYQGDREQLLYTVMAPLGAVVGQLNGAYGVTPQGTMKVNVSQQPKHGKLVLDGFENVLGTSSQMFKYIPDNTFKYNLKTNENLLGEDHVKFKVTANSHKFTVSYVIKVVMAEGHECDAGMSDELSTNAEVQFALEGLSEDISDLANQFSVDQNSANVFDSYVATLAGTTYSFGALATPQFTFTNLPSTAVGQTIGEGTAANILLDTNAAGRGWFMDSTPLSNDECLPTSNPNEWIAKAGSAAADKMDLLSVLLHEYGHALGFEHSSDPHDFMGTSLTAGVRRLPSADEMQLMANLIGEIRAQHQRHSALDAESRTGFDEIAGLARNDKLYSSRRLG